jgi:phospholipid/cholesterol/gamma-HCH transport system substrate-binding protein
METRAHHVLVGSFVLGVLAMVAVAIIWLASLQFDRQYQLYTVYFTGSVTGLNEGAPVRYNGIPVGQVTGIRIAPKNVQQVEVTVKIDVGTPIKDDAVASLELQGITGLVYVQITAGSPDAPPLVRKADQPYPVIAARRSRLEKLVRSAPELIESAIIVSDRIADLLNDDNRHMIADTLVNLDKASAALGSRAETLGHAIDGAAGTVDELQGLVKRANTLLVGIDTAVNGKDGLSETARQTLVNIDQLTRRLGDTNSDLDRILQQNGPALREFGQRGLPDLQQLIGDARGLVAELTRVAAQLERDPPRFLFGDRREGYSPR